MGRGQFTSNYSVANNPLFHSQFVVANTGDGLVCLIESSTRSER